MEKEEKIKCPNCGFSNLKNSKKCGKCGTIFGKTKSCPRCARKNKIDVKKCTYCGYHFKSNRKMVIQNLIISVFIVLVLGILLTLELTGVVRHIDRGFKIVAILLIVFILYTTIHYGAKEVISYGDKPDLHLEKEKFSKMKMISNIAIIVGGILIAILLIYFYFFR